MPTGPLQTPRILVRSYKDICERIEERQGYTSNVKGEEGGKGRWLGLKVGEWRMAKAGLKGERVEGYKGRVENGRVEGGTRGVIGAEGHPKFR